MWELTKVQNLNVIKGIMLKGYRFYNNSFNHNYLTLSFMQSYAWLKFIYHYDKTFFLLKNNNYKVVWPLQVIKTHFGNILWGRHLFMPENVVDKSVDFNNFLGELRNDIKRVAYDLDVISIRLQFRIPCIKNNNFKFVCSNGKDWYKRCCGWYISPMHEIDFERTIIVDLNKIGRFSSIVKRSVNKAKKEGYNFIIGRKDKDDICTFYKLYRDMFKRKGFYGHSKRYICDQYLYLSKANQAYLFWITKNHNRFYGAVYFTDPMRKIAFYVHGAGLYNSSIPFGYVIHNNAIDFFRGKGVSFLDLGGVSPLNKLHPLFNNSIIKRRFGGLEYKFWHALELPLSFKWYLYAVNSYLKNMSKGWYRY